MVPVISEPVVLVISEMGIVAMVDFSVGQKLQNATHTGTGS